MTRNRASPHGVPSAHDRRGFTRHNGYCAPCRWQPEPVGNIHLNPAAGPIVIKRDSMEPKVSVVVSTHNSQHDVHRLDESLRGQTLPQSDFEVIYVDDGSTDATLEILNELAASFDNTHVISIDNSGWPCRPRNVGIDAARGEYVAIMDDDDVFFPDALRAAYEFGKSNNSDVVNPKESHSEVPSWSMAVFKKNVPNARNVLAPFSLMALNPRKLYRRQFLNDHQLRFLDNGERVPFEDALFNMAVFAKASVVSILADTPYAVWVQSGQASISSTVVLEPEERFKGQERVLRTITETTEAGSVQRDSALLYVHHSRGAGFFSRHIARKTDDELSHLVELAHTHTIPYLDPHLDDLLASSLHDRSTLLRARKNAELREIAAWDEEVVGRTTLTRMRSTPQGGVRLSLRTVWRRSGERKPGIYRDEAGVLRRAYPEAVRGALGREVAGLDRDIQDATVRLGVRHRSQPVTWTFDTRITSKTLEGPDQDLDLVVESEVELTGLETSAGNVLNGGSWVLNSFTALFQYTQQRPLRVGDSTITRAYTAADGRVMTVARVASGYELTVARLTVTLDRSGGAPMIRFVETDIAPIKGKILMGRKLVFPWGDRLMVFAQRSVAARRLVRLLARARWTAVDRTGGITSVAAPSRLGATVFIQGIPYAIS
ncbi:glycosyltransferase family 2 protein [Mycetocola reblochoni]|nr:glycosyltransferase family 2 protein [Mycetocola reblochoni]